MKTGERCYLLKLRVSLVSDNTFDGHDGEDEFTRTFLVSKSVKLVLCENKNYLKFVPTLAVVLG